MRQRSIHKPCGTRPRVSPSLLLRISTRYGYRTLGEAMASVRSFSVNYNRTYTTVGVRGFNLPWDYGSRILVMVNGHNRADHAYYSMLWCGEQFRVEVH